MRLNNARPIFIVMKHCKIYKNISAPDTALVLVIMLSLTNESEITILYITVTKKATIRLEISQVAAS